MAMLVSKIQNKLTQRRLKSQSMLTPRNDYIPHKPLARITAKSSLEENRVSLSSNNSNASRSSETYKETALKLSQGKDSNTNENNMKNSVNDIISQNRSEDTDDELSDVFEEENSSINDYEQNSCNPYSLKKEVNVMNKVKYFDRYNNNIKAQNNFSDSQVLVKNAFLESAANSSNLHGNETISAMKDNTSKNNDSEIYGVNFNKPFEITSSYRENYKSNIFCGNNKRADMKLDWQNKSLDKWSTNDVLNWTASIGLMKIAETIKGSGLQGQHLQKLKKDSLAELGLNEEESKVFIDELAHIMKNQVTLWSLQQTSIRRRHLEQSTDELSANLEKLQKLNEEQDHLIATSMAELQLEQEVAEELLKSEINEEDKEIENLSIEAERFKSQMAKPVSLWNTSDVCRWLEKNSLTDFIPKFSELGVTGIDLVDENLQILDRLENFSTSQKETLYSATYKLLDLGHPPSKESIARIYTDDEKEKLQAAFRLTKLSSRDDVLPRGDVSSEPTDVRDGLARDPVSIMRNHRPSTAFGYFENEANVPSLYDQLGNGTFSIRRVEFFRAANCNFMVEVLQKGHVVVVEADVATSLKVGDRIIEVCGHQVHNILLTKLFNQLIKDYSKLQLVVLTHLSMQISDDYRVLQNKLNISENHWSRLRRLLIEMRDEDEYNQLQNAAPEQEMSVANRNFLENNNIDTTYGHFDNIHYQTIVHI